MAKGRSYGKRLTEFGTSVGKNHKQSVTDCINVLARTPQRPKVDRKNHGRIDTAEVWQLLDEDIKNVASDDSCLRLMFNDPRLLGALNPEERLALAKVGIAAATVQAVSPIPPDWAPAVQNGLPDSTPKKASYLLGDARDNFDASPDVSEACIALAHGLGVSAGAVGSSGAGGGK